MAKTNAQKQKAYRDRKRLQLGKEEYNRKETERKRAQWHEDLEKSRTQHRQKMKRQRSTIRDEPLAEDKADVERIDTPQATRSPHSYTRISSLSRAISRVKNRLPKSPRKKKAVIKALTTSFADTPTCSSCKPKHSQRKGLTAISQEVEARVREFYLRQDVSWTFPGLRDFKTVTINGANVGNTYHR